jgi:membrane-bound serine protease (ClpP class)
MSLLLLMLGVLFAAALCVVLCAVAVIARRKKHAPRGLNLKGRTGSVVAALRPEGAVLVDGELWRACAVPAGATLERGRVRVTGARGHLLEVEADG